MKPRILISVLLGGLVLLSCNQKKVAPNPPTPVNLYEVKKQHVLYYDKYPATTEALSQVDLHAEVTGYITGIFFTEGAHVTKGQKLYEIDERLYKASYDQAVANLQVAQGNLVQAQQDADRYQYLARYNAVATQTLDHALIALQNAKNQVNAADQQVKTAATNLTYSIIYAPFDGTIGFSQVKMGNLISVGTTVLNTISTDNPMAVDFLVNEAQLAHYEDLEKNKQHNIDSLFTIILPNQSIYAYEGKISVIDRAVDPQTGSIRVRLAFPNPKIELKVGMDCIVRVKNQDATEQLVIPSKAVVEQMGEYFVFVAKDTVYTSGADSAAKKQSDSSANVRKLRAFQSKVQLGQTIGADVIVKSGINVGDKIVVDGVQAIHEASLINASSVTQGSGKSENARNQNKDSSKNN
jgi:membrane fusion protein, multidrug efflux system